MKISEIKKLIREIIKEVGESNISPIPYKKLDDNTYEFNIDIDGENIITKVKFTNLNKHKYSKHGMVPQIYKDSNKTFTFGFTVGGKMDEFKTTESNVWFKILNTVIYLIQDFIKNNNPDVLIFLPYEKIDGDTKKSNIYQAYMEKQISKYPQYTYEKHDMYTMIYKKY